ncbi:thiopeptide-type bacteriocin biosynthesis protein [Nonomuraea sp. NPDC049649]|uniref:thiopeptide-type bacteriocin biosynthesis protein n=1 Tax=Nonomuraea sp. NPDC049649 TaxID=3155776 RepID=UPI0034485729
MNSSPWRQANLAFPDWAEAERTAVIHLAPLLFAAETKRLVASWFFIRKAPCWRVRYLPRDERAQACVLRHLGDLTRECQIDAVTEVVYEPESLAFGGADGMTTAHRLFHADSRHLLTYLADTASRPDTEHRRELSILLCTTLLRAAGLDWYEQGDVWAQIAAHRGLPDQGPPDRRHALETNVRRLMSVDATMRDGTPLAFAATWSAAFATAGRELAGLAADGRLHRGLRAVLAHHVVFAWNRLGLPYTTQAVLAHTAKKVVFGSDPTVQVADETRNERT